MEGSTWSEETTYTWSEMFDELRCRGLNPPTRRQFFDWIEKGLIDRSITHSGAGRGKGTQRGRWPRTQFELLAILVAKREEVERGAVVALTNAPTLLWLGWGEKYVPIRQVRRAVGTWGQNYQNRSGRVEKVSKEATRLARELKGPGARREDIRHLGDALSAMVVSKQPNPKVKVDDRGKTVEVDLLDIADKVIDPEGNKREFGAPGASVNSTKLHTGIVAMQYASAHASQDLLRDLRGSSDFWFTDAHYRQARQRWFTSHYEYQHMQPLLRVAGPPDLYKPLTLDDVGNNACRDVLMLLGLGDPRMPRPGP